MVDPLLESLRALPSPELDPTTSERIRRSARRALLDEGARGPGLLARVWSRVVAPALVTGTVATYLVWATEAAGALYR